MKETDPRPRVTLPYPQTHSNFSKTRFIC